MQRASFTAAELARRFALELHGDADTSVSGVATLARAGRDELTFLANPRYRSQLAESEAGIVVMGAGDAEVSALGVWEVVVVVGEVVMVVVVGCSVR